MTSRDIIKLNYSQFLFVFFAFFIMVVVSYFYASRIVREQLLENGEKTIQTAVANMQAELSKSEIFLIDTSFYVENMINNNSSQEEIGQLFSQLTHLLQRDQDSSHAFTGVGIYGYVRGEYLDGENRLLPSEFDSRLSSWYLGAEQKSKGIHYTRPYEDVTIGQRVLSMSQKIFDKQGNDCGVIGLDIDVSSLSAFLDVTHLAEDGYGLILNTDMSIMIHGQDSRMDGQDLRVATEHSTVIIDALLEDGFVSGMQYTNYNQTKCIAFFRKLFNGWYIGIVTPTSSYYSNVYRMALVLSILGFGMMLLLGSSLMRLYTAKFRSEEENKSKSNFLARMSHEIRTPMNAIVGMAELILREDIRADIYEYAMGIKQASANLLSIINDILDFSKIESGKMEITETDYLLSSVVNDIVTIIRMRLSEKPIVFIVDVDSCLPNKLIGDEVRIRQVILNVLNNAVKYTEKGSISFTIKGEMGNHEKYVLLSIIIEDTGKGIKLEDRDKVFGDFVQLDKGQNKGIEGSGLGLAITKSLCDAMKGGISFTSEYGKGTAFTVTIPQRIREHEQIASVINAQEMSVLIYEINNVYADSIMHVLDNLGVSNDRVTLQSSFYEILRAKSYTFIFVSLVLFEGAKKIMERIDAKAKLVIIAEYGAEIGPRNICTLSMPAHVLSVADILNDKTENHLYTNEKRESIVRFIAPSARILIVDDINTNLKVAEGLMAPFKMQVDICKSGAEAIELVKANTYDIVFMDHMMPEMDGIEATNLIRGLGGKQYKELPIIALTANAVSGVKEMFLQNGMSDFLSKPIEISRLNSILQKWIPEEKREKYHDNKKVDSEEQEEKLLIKGVDTQKGISMTGGSLDTYLNTLGIFLDDGKEKISQIASCLEESNIILYTTYVHALKSASASIGADAVSGLAKDLENAGRNEDIDHIKKHNAVFITEFEELLENISQVLASRRNVAEVSSDNVDIESLKHDLVALKEALDIMDTGKADEIMNRLQKGNWGKSIQESIENISRHILLSDYDEAVAVVDTLLAEAVQ